MASGVAGRGPAGGRATASSIWTGWPSALQRPGRAAVAIRCMANNESGVIQPIAEAAALVRAAGGWLHVDAIQSAGKIAVDIRALDADTLTLSAPQAGRAAGRRRAGAGASG